jgi:Ca2+-transporting ATPase
MITGDYPGTAAAIAREIGLVGADKVVSGPELDGMSPEELRDCVRTVNVFARVTPEQKLKLVTTLKADGQIVAMTGDGVNDAPALKAAHIGIAMGRRGSDVAREAASLVLLDDEFASIVVAVGLGRRIYDNIRKATRYIVAVHVPTAGMAMLPLLFDWPLVFYPVHIVFLEFVIDPACSIAFEAEPAEADTMRRPPRPATARLFDARLLASSMLQGLIVLAAVAALYAWAMAQATPEGEARAMAFIAIVVGNLGLILVDRSRETTLIGALSRPNPALWWIVVAALAGLAATLLVGPLRDVFRFAALTALQVAASAAAAIAGIVLIGCSRSLRR